MRCTTRAIVIGATAAFGSLCSFLWLLTPVTLARELLFKGIVAVAMVQLCFVPRRLSSLIKLTVTFLLLSALVAGVTYALALSGSTKTGESPPRIGWYLLMVGPLLLTHPLRGLWVTISKYFRRSHQSALFRFVIGGRIVEQEAVLDTGNTLHEPLSLKPVVLVDVFSVEDKLPQELRASIQLWYKGGAQSLDSLPYSLMDRISLIPYTTVSDHGLMIGIRPEICELWASGVWHKVDAVIGFPPGRANLAGKTALLPYTIWPVENC